MFFYFKIIFILFIPFTSIHASDSYTCSSFHNSTKKECQSNYKGLTKKACLVCAGTQSCLWTFSDNKYRSMCQAYLEGQSCLFAFKSGAHRRWCEVLKGDRDCSVFDSSVQKRNCELGIIPPDHSFWFN